MLAELAVTAVMISSSAPSIKARRAHAVSATDCEVAFLPWASSSSLDTVSVRLGHSKSKRERIDERFSALASEWRKNTAHLSSTTEKALYPAYQQIIGMGKDALPLILRDLRARPAHWFWALKAIAREDPVAPEERGNVRAMTKSWLHWGAEHGYIRVV